MSWWRFWQRKAPVDTDEVCRVCFKELDSDDCLERIEHLANMAEMGDVGGTYLTGYWCREHAPADAVPWRG